MNVPIYKGAGQFRTVGRMISMYSISEIAAGVERSVHQLSAGDVHAELAEVSRALGFQTPSLTGPADTWVFVVTSLAGGTGSGVFLDVCDVIRGSAAGATWTDESIGLMYTGEVFGELRPADRAGVNANSLGCLAEVMAGYWRDRPSVAATQLMNLAGVHPTARSGPRYPFLVGASNATGVKIGKQAEIYGVVGNALASFLTSPNLQSGMAEYTTANWNAKATANGYRSPLLRETTDEQPFSALGVARLTLGRDRFADYAIDRLSRTTVSHLLEGPLAQANIEQTTPHEIIDRRASDLLQSFLRQVHLNERSEQHNDVIDALRPDGRDARLQAIRNSIEANIGGLDPTTGRDWEEIVMAQLLDQRGRMIDASTSFAGNEAEEFKSQTQQWNRNIQQRIANVTAEYMAVHGLAVTNRLLGLVREELAIVQDELVKEGESLQIQYRAVKRTLADKLDGVGRRVRATHDQVQAAVISGVECLRFGAEAQLRGRAAALLRDLSDDLVRPLAEEIERSRQSLQLQASNTNPLHGPIVTAWPREGAVPDSYGARDNEFLLESHESFGNIFEKMLVQTVNASTPVEARQVAITSVVTGCAVDDLARQAGAESGSQPPSLADALEIGAGVGQSLIAVKTAWVPKDANLRDGSLPPSAASFSVSLDVASDIQARATRFVANPDASIGRYVKESLRRYLEDDSLQPDELEERLSRFTDRFRQLVRTSAPLANIDQPACTLAHPNAQQLGQSVRTFSVIPFSDVNSQAYKIIATEAATQNLNIDADSFRESDASSISAFSFLPAPLQPHVFSSVNEPILADWRRCQARLQAGDSDPIGTFWKLRRSRSLVDFTPLPGPSRRAAIRGWFIGKMLGLVEVEYGSNPVVRVWNMDAGRWAELPRPLLGGPVRNKFDELPRVLETLPIAMIAQARSDAANRPLAPYERLVVWGRDPSYQPGQLEYQSIGDPLLSWVLTGRSEEGAPEPSVELAGPTGEDSVQERLESCLRTVTAASTAYLAQCSSVAQINLQIPQQFFGASPVVELAEDLEVIFPELVSALEHVRPHHDPTGPGI